jgi:hypothetical protein
MTVPRRVVTNVKQLEKLIMDITSHDLNRQMQKLVSDYHKSGDEQLLEDAAYLRSEFDTWWNEDFAEFVPPAAV